MSSIAYKSFFSGFASGVLLAWIFMIKKFGKRSDPPKAKFTSSATQGTLATRVAEMQAEGKSQDYIDKVVKIIQGHQEAKALKVTEAEAVVVPSPKISDEEISSLSEQLKFESENNEWFAAVRAHKSRMCDDQELPETKKQRGI